MSQYTQYWADGEQWEKDHPRQMVKVVPTESPQFNVSVLYQNIDMIDSMSDADVKSFVSKNYSVILKNIFDSPDSARYIARIQDERVLNAFIDVFGKITPDSLDLVRMNTVCYHYLTLPKDKQDERIVHKMILLSSTTNRLYLPKLIGFGLSQNLASMILMARFSDLDMNICVRRVNFIIMTQPIELMTEQLIENIFRTIYDCMHNFSRIFQYFMLDTIPEYDENNETTYWVTEEVSEIDSTISLVILNILDNLPSQMIRDTLINYAEGINSVYSNRPVRFSMRTLSGDYYRINNVIEGMEMNEGIYLP